LANMETVVITGAAGGMGSAVAALFRSKGYQVLGTDCQEIAGVDFQVVGDVADEVTWGKISTVIEQNDLEVVSLINIAGRNYFNLVDDAIKSEWLNMFEVNVVAMVIGIKHLVPYLRKAKAASIVNMSSISAQIGTSGYSAYVATKGAVDSLTKALALELAPQIRINAVAPGWIETPFTVAGLNLTPDPVAHRKKAEQMHALNRVGTPEEIAKVIYFLASSESSFLTGSIVVADGGYLIKN
jgi:meso-butanediol dehydrogenase / (S,S)-butanediol dehydrogenase / diacetyl reductase